MDLQFVHFADENDLFDIYDGWVWRFFFGFGGLL